MSSSLYSQLPETAEMRLAKTVQEFQSEVLAHDDAFQHVSSVFISLFYAAAAGLAERLQMN